MKEIFLRGCHVKPPNFQTILARGEGVNLSDVAADLRRLIIFDLRYTIYTAYPYRAWIRKAQIT
jgi:hypothetical protein